MMRLVTGFLVMLGSVGGMEMASLSPIAAFFLGIIGLQLFVSPVIDGTVQRLADRI